MPDVTCMNLQDAQDLIQEHGVGIPAAWTRPARAADSGSTARWTVVSQIPVAGTPIDEGDAVLSVVRNGEPDDSAA